MIDVKDETFKHCLLMASNVYGFIWNKRETKRFDDRGAKEIVDIAKLLYYELENLNKKLEDEEPIYSNI